MTNPSPIVAPNVPNYAVFNPYITAEEFQQSATGVDSSNLVPKGSREANQAALTTLIGRASNYADGLCHQVLCATLDVQSGSYRIKGDGTVVIPLDYTPIVQVTGVSLGATSSQLTALADLSGIGFRKKSIVVPAYTAWTGPLTGPGGSGGRAGWLNALVQYVNGYANTTLTADTTTGGQQVTVQSALGIFPGLALQIYDGQSTEAVTVAPSYVQGSATVPLTAAMLFGHDATSSISAMPPAIKFAVAKLTTWMIKTRGATAMVISSIGSQPAKQAQSDPGGNEDYDDALDALQPFMRVA